MSEITVRAAIDAEIVGLEQQLEGDPRYQRLMKLRAWRESELAESAISKASRRPTRSKTEKTTQLLDLAVELIRGNHRNPVPTATILRHAQQKGLAGKGRKASNRLSATLSHYDFRTRGREGWLLPDIHVSLPTNTEAAGPSLESGEPAASADRHLASGGTQQGRGAGPGGGT